MMQQTISNQNDQIQPLDNSVAPGLTSAASFDLLQRVANAFSRSNLVPKEFQGNLPNTLIALNMSQRMEADPMLVMQNLYIVHGKPAWSSQFLIAMFNKCGRFSALKYEFSGKENTMDWGCRATATEIATGEKMYGPEVTIKMAKDEGWLGKNGSKWQTMPQLMFRYRAAALFIRTIAPELALGLHIADELEDIQNVKAQKVISKAAENSPQQTKDNAVQGLNEILEAEITEQTELKKKQSKKEKQSEPIIEAVAEIVNEQTGEVEDPRTPCEIFHQEYRSRLLAMSVGLKKIEALLGKTCDDFTFTDLEWIAQEYFSTK